MEHAEPDVGVDQRFISPQGLETELKLDRIALWTDESLMKLKE